MDAFRFKSTLRPYLFYTYSGVTNPYRRFLGDRSQNPVPFFRYGTTGPVGQSTPVVHAFVIQRALAQAMAKANNQELNLSNSFAELGETAQTVVDRATKLVKALAYARKGQWSKAFTEFGVKGYKQNGSTWLEYQYGWRPLVGDLLAGVDLLQKGLARPLRVTCKSQVKESYPMPESSTATVMGGFWYQGCFVRLDYVVSSQTLHSLNQTGLASPLVTLWEVVPFSFLVDWILPIGTWLEALHASIGLTFKSGSQTIRNWGEVDVRINVRSTEGNGASPLYENVFRSLYYEGSSVRRTVYALPPIPLLYMRNPLSSLNRVALPPPLAAIGGLYASVARHRPYGPCLNPCEPYVCAT